MGEMGNLIGTERAAATGVLGPAEHPGLEEGAIDDQLPAALEQIEQAGLALRPLERVTLLHRRPGHPPAFGGHRITRARERFLLDEELLARGLPILRRYDRWRARSEKFGAVLRGVRLAALHLFLLFVRLFVFAGCAAELCRPLWIK